MPIFLHAVVELPKYVFHTTSFLILKVALFKIPFESIYVKISVLLSLIQAMGNHSCRCSGTFVLYKYNLV